MHQTKNFLAFDLGAESGRAVVGRFDGEKLSLEEVHRFPNGPTRIMNNLHWNTLSLFANMKDGLSKAINELGLDLAAFGLDTWGVDFGLIDRNGELIGNPYHYRDGRTDGLVEKSFGLMPREEIFGHTGIQFMQLNTFYQLYALVEQKSPVLEIADRLLMMPDLFNYWFTGQKVSEYTIASTTQCYNMQQNQWAASLLEKFDIPTGMFPDIVQPGTELGPLLPVVADEIGVSAGIPVIAPGCHDTGSAVAGVPVTEADRHNFAYISSGTWSLIGTETVSPVINDKTLAYNFTNEGGVEQTIRLLKNLTGMWLVQECRRTWAQQGEDLSYAELTQLAEQAAPFAALLNPDHADFFSPGDMPARISDFCANTNQTPPADIGAVIRAVLESLALKYRWAVERIEELVERPIDVVHIVGGGCQNQLLNQFAANATGRRVVAGPVEATAIGNILMQMLAVGQISSLSEGREIVRASFPVETYEPADSAPWTAAYQRFLGLPAG